MKKGKITKNLSQFLLLIALLSLFLLSAIRCNSSNDKQILGVWWWNSNLNSEYLNFAKQNGINEIYYYEGSLGEKSSSFIEKASKLDIDVYWLIGEVEWLRDSADLYRQIDDFVQYNSSHPNAQYNGVHLDIEPHQDDNFDNDREFLIYNLIDIASNLDERYPNVSFDFDLPFWLEDEIKYKGITKPAYAHMIDIADRIFLMSYRDSASGMLDVSSDEIEYAKLVNKPLILGAETGQTEEDEIVTFYEEGKSYMNSELEKVRAALPKNFGLSIHHILSWQELKQ